MKDERPIERTIWIFWHQGFAHAPDAIRICVQSWKVRNPDWQVVQLDNENLAEYVDRDFLAQLRGLRNLSLQKFANLLRLYLVAIRGGVWADATCFCARPLSDWLPEYLSSGFFAFRRRPDLWLSNVDNQGLMGYLRRGGDRIMANWFLASVSDNPLASIFLDEHLRLFRENSFTEWNSNKGARRVRFLTPFLNRNPRLSQLWLHPWVTQTIQTYPYFIFHYHFAKVINQHEVCDDIWSRTPVFLGDRLSRLKRQIVAPVTDGLRAHMESPNVPLHKLTWRYPAQDYREGCVLDYLERSIA